MDKCPLNGKPCPHKKCIHVTECNPNYTAKETKDLCHVCGIPYCDQSEQPATPKEVVAVFDLINNLISAKKSQITAAAAADTVAAPSKKCPNCGFTLSDIANTSKIGCSECYKHFKEEIKPFIFNYHQASKHLGKSPRKPVNIEDLKKELEVAVKKEDYEKAAKLRDEIKNLE